MKKVVLLIVSLFFLTGCASGGLYYESVNHANETASKIELARAQADVERIRALQRIADTGDQTAQTAAVIAIAMGSQGQGGGNNSVSMTAPQRAPDASEQALRWAGVLAPSLTTLYGINRNSAVQMEQIDANREISIHSNDTMLGFGRLAAGQEAPIVGGRDDRLIFPVDENATVIGEEGDVLLSPTSD